MRAKISYMFFWWTLKIVVGDLFVSVALQDRCVFVTAAFWTHRLMPSGIKHKLESAPGETVVIARYSQHPFWLHLL